MHSHLGPFDKGIGDFQDVPLVAGQNWKRLVNLRQRYYFLHTVS